MELTEEEEFEFRLRQEQEAAAAQQQQQAAAPVRGESGLTLEDIRGGGQRILKGLTAGFGDEITGLGRAVGDMFVQDYDFGDDVRGSEGRNNFGDNYTSYRDEAREVDAEFAKNNPKSALALELGTAILSPINKIAPGLGTTGGTGSRVAQAIARGGAEGALAGYGESTGENVANDIGTGLMMGGAFSGALSGIGGGIGRVMSNKRVEQDLIDPITKEFTPLNLAHKGTLGDLYRNTLGRTFGGRRKLIEQAEPFVDRADALVDSADRGIIAAEEAGEQLKRTTRDTLDLEAEQIRDAARVAKEKARDTAKLGKSSLKKTRQQLLAETEQALDDQQVNFRAMAGQEAFPDDYRVSELEGVDMTDPQQVAGRLKDFWNKRAFRMVKDRDFDWDRGLGANIRSQMEREPELAMTMADIPGLFDSLQRNMGLDPEIAARFKSGATSGKDLEVFLDILNKPNLRIDGEALMGMRNFFAKKKGDNRWAYQRVKGMFDDMITNQLDEVDPNSAAAFRDQLDRYTTNLNFRDAAKAARKTGGQFTTDQWLSAGGKYGDAAAGRAPLQGEATQVVNNAAAAQRAAGLDKARRAKVSEILDKRRVAAERRASAGLRKATRDLDRKGRNRAAMDEADQMVSGARTLREGVMDSRRELKSLEVPNNPSGLSELLTTRTLGNGLGLVGNSLASGANILTGTAAARALTSKLGQRIVAGQTSPQAALARAIREGYTAPVTRGLSRTAVQKKLEEEQY